MWRRPSRPIDWMPIPQWTRHHPRGTLIIDGCRLRRGLCPPVPPPRRSGSASKASRRMSIVGWPRSCAGPCSSAAAKVRGRSPPASRCGSAEWAALGADGASPARLDSLRTSAFLAGLMRLIDIAGWVSMASRGTDRFARRPGGLPRSPWRTRPPHGHTTPRAGVAAGRLYASRRFAAGVARPGHAVGRYANVELGRAETCLRSAYAGWGWGSGCVLMWPSTSRWGSQLSQRGRYQLRSPSSTITLGSTTERITVASISSDTAMPNPIC